MITQFRSWAETLADCSPAFIEYIEQKLNRVERQIEGLLLRESPFIREAGLYIMKAGGKRLRPLLLIVSARLGDYPGDDDVLFGVVVEYIHTATLVHDDIIDNAQERRGQLSVHRRWSGPVAVLLGDYFYTKAMALALDYGHLKILRILSNITLQTLQGEIAEQVQDGNLWITEPQIMDIIYRKTACLFSGCCQIAAILAGLPPGLEASLAEFGRYLGIAFQIVDDMLDYSADPHRLGKPVLHDLLEGKVTLPLYYLLRQAAPDETAPVRAAFQRRDPSLLDTQALQRLMDKYRILPQVQRVAETYARQALTVLQSFPRGEARQLLEGLIRFIIRRPS
ncbi:MAG: polyprenyl synthetase family protein [Acidobacteria bacterium]|nr:polyprenyl synthetase family protein [Acidobacteriota bacterium]MDW7984190.1 polyprenyl synthetase family protein [Acidobacteriota bacterium]